MRLAVALFFELDEHYRRFQNGRKVLRVIGFDIVENVNHSLHIAQRQGNFLWAIAVVFVFCLGNLSLAQTSSRYVGEYSDSTPIGGDVLSDWHGPKSATQLDGHDLFAPARADKSLTKKIELAPRLP